MIRNGESGMTLIELIVAMVVASLMAGILFSAYVLVVRIWNDHSRKIEVSDRAWTVYRTMERLVMKSYEVKKIEQNRWRFYDGRRDSSELVHENDSLFFGDSTKITFSGIDSFHFSIVDTSGLYSMWECRFNYSREKNHTGMVWRTLCRANYQGDTVPTPITPHEPRGFYWENRE